MASITAVAVPVFAAAQWLWWAMFSTVLALPVATTPSMARQSRVSVGAASAKLGPSTASTPGAKAAIAR